MKTIQFLEKKNTHYNNKMKLTKTIKNREKMDDRMRVFFVCLFVCFFNRAGRACIVQEVNLIDFLGSGMF